LVLKNGVVIRANANQMNVQALQTLLSQVGWSSLEAMERKPKS
jgi:hypothetical protein